MSCPCCAAMALRRCPSCDRWLRVAAALLLHLLWCQSAARGAPLSLCASVPHAAARHSVAVRATWPTMMAVVPPFWSAAVSGVAGANRRAMTPCKQGPRRAVRRSADRVRAGEVRAALLQCPAFAAVRNSRSTQAASPRDGMWCAAPCVPTRASCPPCGVCVCVCAACLPCQMRSLLLSFSLSLSPLSLRSSSPPPAAAECRNLTSARCAALQILHVGLQVPTRGSQRLVGA